MAAINIDVGANTRRAEKDIQRLVNRSYNINLRTKGDQPLGRITGKVNEFTKSLDASNARVIAFGASAGIIFGVQRAFSALASSVIETQKSLQDINVILNVSSSELTKFGSNLFSIAKSTGQSFAEVAKAATEFSRQGLGVAETLKRTNEALILSRLSGLDTAKSVEALTAAVNSFSSQAVTATEVVNKFANVDAAFAVSSADLAEALQRVGSSAAQSGVSLNELIAIVTSAQQTTARGGAVIGNSFKTIFTRLQRSKVVNLLEGLGVDTKDSTGQIKSTINLLQDLAKVYDQLGTLEQANVAEKVGGVFQINILKSALADLGKEYSIYNNALQVAASSTDQAIRRNEELNKTYAAQLNALRENAKQAGAGIGERLFGPAFDRVVGNTNDILGGINESDGKGVGAVLGKGILDGLGQVIAGPGLALLGGIFIKLFSDLAKFATGSLKELLNLNAASKQQEGLQQSVNQILQKNPELFKLMQQGTAGLNKGAEILLSSLRAQTLELQKQEAISAKIAAQFIRSGSVTVAGGVPVAKTPKPGKAAGFIPNFASDRITEKYSAISLGASPSVRPMMSKGTIGGKKFVMNNQELEFPNVGKNGDSMVIPLYGGGEKLLTATGFIPNFARVEDIARINSRVRERLNFSQSSRGDRRLNPEDLINLSGRAYTQNQFPIKPKESFKAYEKRVIQQFGYKSGEELRFISSAAVDGYKVSRSGNQTLIDLLEVKGGRNWNPISVLNKFLRALPENYFTKNALDVFTTSRDDIKVGASLVTPYTKGKAVLNQKRLLKRSRGFIPNFAQTKEPPVQLGNLDKIPNKLGNKVLSLIYPGLSEGYALRPATASYLKKQYTGNIPVAGISQKKLQSQLPDIDKNIGNLLVKEANQFGQALGGFNFLKSPEELPNYGAAKGAVGVAFEGGVQTLLQQKVGKQNAGIDFRNITPRLRSIFNNAPGIYDAKRSPELTNEVLQKLLNETKPGATVQKTSGKAGAAYLKERSAAVDQLRKEGVTGSVAIRQALRDRFGIVGKAAGFIPNFAKTIVEARERAIQTEKKAGKGAVLDEYKGMQYVRQPGQSSNFNAMIKKDHPEGLKRAIQNSAASQGLSSGFIPNFAPEDTEPADLGSSIGALASQLGFLGFALQGVGDSYKNSLNNLTKTNVDAAKQNLRLARESGVASKEVRRQLSQNVIDAKQTTPGQKAGAAIGSAGFALTIAAPIIAETIANAIGKESKTDRTLGAGASALGQIGSFAGLGALIAPIPLIGAAIGGSAGALLGLIDVIKQASTDIPELSAAAKKASENLTKINDAGQKVQTSFEQIKQLREGGQGERAGQLEADLLSFIRKEFRDTPELVSGASAAVINQDFVSLQKVIGENTNAILKNTLAQQKNLLIGEFIEGAGGKEAGKQFVDIVPVENFNEEALNRLIEFSNQASQIKPDVVRKVTEGEAFGNPLNIQAFENTKVISENLLNFLASTDKLSPEEIDRLRIAFENDPALAIEALAAIRDPALDTLNAIKAIARNSAASNKVIALITKTLQTVQSNYAKLARQSQSALDLQLLGESSIRKSRTNIGVSQFETKAVQEELFGITTPAGRADSKTQGELFKIEGDFANTIKDSVGETISLIGSAFLEQQRKSFDALSTIGGDDNAQKNAEANLETAAVLAEAVKQGFNIEQFRSLLDIGDPTTFTGFDVEAKLSEIAEALRIPEDDPESQKRLDTIRDAINKTNQELVKNKAVLIEQKTILANQKFQESLRELITSINSAFGGLQAFINNDTSITSALNKAIANLKIIGEPTGEKGIIAVGRNLQRVVSELSKITGRNLGPELGENSKVIQSIRQARALDIENKLTNVVRGLSGIEGDRGKEILAAFRKSLEKQAGVDPSEIAKLSGPELIKRYSETVAKQQVDAENKTGQLNQKLIDQAKLALPPELRNLLDVNADFLSVEQIISAQFSQANNTLQQILTAIQNTQNSPDLKIAKFLQDPLRNSTLFDTRKGGDGSPVIGAGRSAIDRIAPMPKKPRAFAAGSIPSEAIPAMMAEQRDIKKGVGGARSSDRPTFIPNFNGAPVVANAGEQLIKNYMGTGKSALLTRDMQNMAGGYIPSEDVIQKIIKEWNFDPSPRNIEGVTEWLRAQGKALGSEKEFLNEINDFKAAKAGIFSDAYSNKVIDPKLKKIETLKRLIERPNTPIGEKQSAQAKLNRILNQNLEEISEKAIQPSKIPLGKQELALPKPGVNMAAKEVAAKGASKTILRALPVIGAILGVGEAGYRTYQGDYSGAALAAGAGLAGLLPGKGSVASIALSAALIAKDVKAAESNAMQQEMINSKARKSARGKKQTPEEKKLSQERQQRALDKARYEFSTAFGKNWPLDLEAEQEFAKLWNEKPATETLQSFTKRFKELAPKQNYKTNIRKATKDDIEAFYGRGKYAKLKPEEIGSGTVAPKTEAVDTSKRTQLTQLNAKFMLQSLIEAYTQALSSQEKGQPTGAKMDQKRALMAKAREFKRLYEQGRYESLREIYEKHQKNDPVKQAYSELATQGIDPNEGYDKAMAYARDQEALYQRSRLARSYGAEAGYIDGRPAQEVLSEMREQNRDVDYENAQQASFSRTDKIQELAAAIKTTPGAAPLMYAGDDSGYDDYLKKRAEELGVKWYSKGFIPPETKSFMEEMKAGFDPNEIYQKRQPEVQGLNNPEGRATFNKPQEGNITKERMAMANRMYVPNFANSIPESSAVSVNLGGLTVNEAQTGGKTQDYAKELGAEIEARVGPLITQIKSEMDQKYGRSMEIISSAERQGKLPRVPPRSRGLV
jgi:TP901 family phage tail tape measure protein